MKRSEARIVGKLLVASNIDRHRELIRQGEIGALFNADVVEGLYVVLVLLFPDQP